MVSEQSGLILGMLDVGEMSRHEDLSHTDKGQIIRGKQLSRSFSETSRFVGCPRSAVMNTYQPWSKEGQTGDRMLGTQDNEFKLLTWPANSPDLNSICGMCWKNKSPSHN